MLYGLTTWRGSLVVACTFVLLGATPAAANLSRNATGPQAMGEAGALRLDTAWELEREENGRAWVLEAGVQYELSYRLQLLFESVLYERQQPDGEESVSGMGDADLTLSWLLREEHGPWPPLVLGAKVKLPTAQEDEIGTGKADFSLLGVIAKEYGELELALETEYATFGSPEGVELKDQFIYTFALDFSVNDYLSLYAEAFGNSAPSAEESRTDAVLVGLELEWPLSEMAAPYVSFEYDSEAVATARAGIEWSW